MITRDQVMPLLLGACPSFAGPWAEYVSDPTYEQGLLYVDLAEFSRHLVALIARGETAEFGPVFAAAERLHTEGDHHVREAAVVGLLEDIQGSAGHQGIDPELFRPWLGPQSAQWWDRVKRFWSGEIDALRDPATAEDEALYGRLVKILYQHDPIGLCRDGADCDAYCREAWAIADDLRQMRSLDEARRITYQAFADLHEPEVVGPEANYAAVAADIWAAWERLRAGEGVLSGPLAGNSPGDTPKPTSRASQLILTLAPGVDLELVHVPAGEFVMGSDDSDNLAYDDEKPRHRVRLDEYHIGRHPVTTAQFRAFADATGYQRNIKLAWDRDSEPVTNVYWDDARAFCAWASRVTGREVRLPTEAEWEKAARGTDGRRWPWGNDEPDEHHCNLEVNVAFRTPVGQYSPLGDSPYGCCDMAGNIWEWTSSAFKPYGYRADDGREDAEAADDCVVRGGAYNCRARDVRCASRRYYHRHDSYPKIGRRYDIGFRVCTSAGHPFCS